MPDGKISPANSYHQSPEGAVDPHECDHPLQCTTEIQRHLLGRRGQDDKVGAYHRHAQQVNPSVKSDNPQDASATVVVCHLKVPQHVDYERKPQDHAGNADSRETRLVVAQEILHCMLTLG